MDKISNNGIFTESNLDSLWRNVKSYRSSDNFMAVMKACSRFRHLAPFNAMLVEKQCPGTRYVLSEKEWRSKYDRGIKPKRLTLRGFSYVLYIRCTKICVQCTKINVQKSMYKNVSSRPFLSSCVALDAG